MKCKFSDCFKCPYPDCINDTVNPVVTYTPERLKAHREYSKKENCSQKRRGYAHAVENVRLQTDIRLALIVGCICEEKRKKSTGETDIFRAVCLMVMNYALYAVRIHQ